MKLGGFFNKKFLRNNLNEIWDFYHSTNMGGVLVHTIPYIGSKFTHEQIGGGRGGDLLVQFTSY
jgi:hypothetical protein